MINIYKKTLKDTKLKKIKAFEKGSWISVVNPDIDEIERLEKELGLDLTIVEDALDENELSRVEKNDGIFYMIIRFPTQSDSIAGTITLPLLVVITDDNIITLSKEENNIINNIAKKFPHFYTVHKTNFLMKIIIEVFNSYDKYLNRILKDIKIKKIKIDNLNNKDILFLVQEEETLNDFESSIVPIISNLERMLSGRYIHIYKKDKDEIEDLFMDSKQTLEISRVALKSIKNIREAYSTILTNELNRVIKILTIATIVLTIPTIISSIYGMNVPLPLDHSPFAFLYVMLLIVFMSVAFLWLLIRRRWI
ncbi:MAG: magnesium transporter CorA family protein [Candidatus Pacebacteria bacterium]|nr:magnesium transporter CorA family protein [Candidatus Paceibacterota bacterium]MCK5413212.1 magnesium transporter CorA family protein [Candidatus Paceibacterota bacterium]